MMLGGSGGTFPRNYLSRIFSKLGVADRANAIIRAKDAGLG